MLHRLKATASLTMRTSVCIKAKRLRPSRQSARKNISGRVLVSMRGIPTSTGMPAVAKIFAHLRAAFRADLGCSSRVYSYNPDAGALSLAFEDLEKPAPAGVKDRPGQPMVPGHSLNVQAFHSDQAVAIDDT